MDAARIGPLSTGLALVLFRLGGRAWALDKQAPAHRGGAQGRGIRLSGEVFFEPDAWLFPWQRGA